MRLWHYKLLNSLPDLQFKGQLRDLVAICGMIKKYGTPNHLLVNKILEFPPEDFATYITYYLKCYEIRYKKIPKASETLNKFIYDFLNVTPKQDPEGIFSTWHDNNYLRVCMANLYEKFFFASGKSQIRPVEWAVLCEKYRRVTHEKYII